MGDKTLWKQGIGKKAMKEFTDLVFQNLPMDRLWIKVPVFNEAGNGFALRMGFKHEGTERSALYRDGVYHDVNIYGMLREEVKSNA